VSVRYLHVNCMLCSTFDKLVSRLEQRGLKGGIGFVKRHEPYANAIAIKTGPVVSGQSLGRVYA
jgi:hypothetical protein